VQQIILNLSINARDAMPAGGELTIETGHVGSAPDLGSVSLRVSDTGTGMSPETKARLFEPFFTTKGVGRGTGLGLSTVYGIVQQSGGTIEVDSVLGKGTTFRISLPCTGDQISPPNKAALRELPPISLKSVLVVEDSESVSTSLKRILTKAGAEVRVAGSAEAALALVDGETEPPQVLITDIVMPGMNGRELAGRLRTRFPRMPILFISGYTDAAIERVSDLGANEAFLQKPFSPEDLLNRLGELLRS
jgi:CheY-like chemotaxis protein